MMLLHKNRPAGQYRQGGSIFLKQRLSSRLRFFSHPSKRFFTGGTDARFARYRRRANSLFAATDSATDRAIQSR